MVMYFPTLIKMMRSCIFSLLVKQLINAKNVEQSLKTRDWVFRCCNRWVNFGFSEISALNLNYMYL